MVEVKDPMKAILETLVKKGIAKRQAPSGNPTNPQAQGKLYKSDYKTFLNPKILHFPDWEECRGKRGRPRVAESIDIRRAKFVEEKLEGVFAGMTVTDCMEELHKDKWQRDSTVKTLFPKRTAGASKTLEQSISRGRRELKTQKKLRKNW